MVVTEWNKLCLLKSDDRHVYFYWAIGDLSNIKSKTDELVELFYVYELNELNVVSFLENMQSR